MSQSRVLVVGLDRVLPQDLTLADCLARLEDYHGDATVVHCSDPETALADARAPVDCVLSGLDPGTYDRFLDELLERLGDVPVVHLADDPDEAVPAGAFRAGLADCVTLGPDADPVEILGSTVEAALARRRQERELEMYETIVEKAPDGVYVTEEDTEIVGINQAGEELIGMSEAEAIGTRFDQLIDDGVVGEELAEQYLEVLPELLSDDCDREVATIEFSSTAPDTDGPRVIRDRLALRPYDDEFRGTIGIARDVTDQKRRERELEQYETVVETMADGVVVVDEDDTIVSVNQRTAELFGLPRSELVGSDVTDLIDEGIVGEELAEQAPPAIEEMLSADSDVEDVTIEFTVTPADDSDERIVRDRLVLRPSDGEYRGTIGLLEDVTDRRRRIEELERYETLVQAIPDTVFATDELGYFTFMNDAGLESYGSGSAAGRAALADGSLHFEEVVDDEGLSRFFEATRRMLSDDYEDTTATIQHYVETLDGRRFPAETNFSIVSRDGEFAGSTGIVRDIATRKQRRQRLAVLDRVLRHNIRNELNVVTGVTDIVATRLRTRHEDDETASLVEMAADAADALIETTDKIRQVQQALERDDMEVTGIEAASVVRNVAASYRDAHPEATIETEFNCEATVAADSTLELAVEELVDNAIVHDDDRPHVTITVTDYEADRGEWYEIRVADDGPGIPELEQSVVEGDADVTQLSHSAGVGLWAVAWIVQSFDGQVAIDVDADGSTVSLRLRGAT